MQPRKYIFIKITLLLLLQIPFFSCKKVGFTESLKIDFFVYPNDSTFLKTFIIDKPRLILTKEKLQFLTAKSLEDPLFKKYLDQCLADAKLMLNSPLPAYNEGWSALNLISNLAFAYLWTGESAYAIKAKTILLKLASFPNWDTPHFINTSTTGVAVSLGLDWLDNYLSEYEKQIIIKSLIDKFLEPGKKGFLNNEYWTNSNSNWNVICNSGIITASLAVAEWHREYADLLIPKAVRALDIALKEFGPDGVWPEGVGYQNECLKFYSYAVSSLLSSTGNDLNLVKNYPYMNSAGETYIACEGRSKYFLSYADIGSGYNRQLSPSLFFLGSIFNNKNLINNEISFLQTKKPNIFHIIWYQKIIPGLISHQNHFYGGKTQMMIFDNDLYSNNSIYLGIKGGQNGSSHGHLDLGNFEFDALGERWARDLGMDNYDLSGYFDYMTATGKRYSYYRVSSLSHNVPIINNSNQNFIGKTSVLNYSTQTESPFCVLNLTSAYESYATRLNRGVRLIDSKRSIIVQDEYTLKTPYDCYWGITTDATIAINDSVSAKLSLNGKELYAKILSPNCKFSVTSARQASPQDPNTGVNRLVAKRTKDNNLNFSIIILLSPNWDGYYSTKSNIIPLSQWK